MEEEERVKVGRALDLLRDSLLPYVDSAMVAAYGDTWTDTVSAEETKRRQASRKWIVEKSDLVVLLDTIIWRKIDPWQTLDQYPRVRSYASELKSTRHQFAHNGKCINEYRRLLDTANRLLVELGLPVPSGLESLGLGSVERVVDERPRVPFDLPAEEWARLGKSGQRLLAICETTDATLGIQMPELDGAALKRMNDHSAKSYLDEHVRRMVDFWLLAGPKRVEMLTEANRLEVDHYEPNSVMKVLPLATRVIVAYSAWTDSYAPWVSEYRTSLYDRMTELAEQELEEESRQPLEGLRQDRLDKDEQGQGTHSGPTADPAPPERGSIRELHDERTELETRLDELSRLLPKESAAELWREVLLLAAGLNDGDKLPNLLLLMGDMSMVGILRHADHADWREEALPFVRDAVARSRLLAAMDPGSKYESFLTSQLREEGKLCNDLGLVDEAIRAFARADEIVDRYPAADPAHLSATLGK